MGMAKLTPEQQTAVEQWAAEGANLNDVQQRLKAEFGISMTYLDARLLMVDLDVKLKEKERPKEPVSVAEAAAPEGPPGAVTVTLDELAIEGAMCSGKVTFSDGKIAGWYIDQAGRLGMRAPEPGYKPPEAEVPVFQEELERVLAAAGF